MINKDSHYFLLSDGVIPVVVSGNDLMIRDQQDKLMEPQKIILIKTKFSCYNMHSWQKFIGGIVDWQGKRRRRFRVSVVK
ncbi:hypothetical protein FEMY_16690 [Ferrovum myxofaciens]|jgi:hypothetical protein|uniref:Uncharacterized protein n=1 Tax=Ferrovum myxofaciens TaxID=416213 RepID=A0A149VX98_9PROT|nr:hypothetical protein FEMY_16690 [Ferrovum myxofaciens]